MTDITNIKDIFTSVKNAIDSTKPVTTGLFKEILKFEPNKTYELRLIPYVKEKGGISKTFYEYVKYTWKDKTTGQWTSVLSPRTWGGKCPINEYTYKIKTHGTPEEIEQLDKTLTYQHGWYMNAYVLADPTNPKNVGEVKIVKIGKFIYDKIISAINGLEDQKIANHVSAITGKEIKPEDVNLGEKVFDLSDNGATLTIPVGKKGIYYNYENSEFTLNKNTDLTKTEIQEIYEKAFDLSTIEIVKTEDEVKKLFYKSYLNVTPKDKQIKEKKSQQKTIKEDEEDIDLNEDSESMRLEKEYEDRMNSDDDDDDDISVADFVNKFDV